MEATPGEIFQLFRGGEPLTRSQICAAAGLSRSPVAEKLESLQRLGFIRKTSPAPSTGGRPAGLFVFSPASHTVIGAHLSGKSLDVGLYDLGTNMIAHASLAVERSFRLDCNQVLATGKQLAAGAGRQATTILGLGLTREGPADHGRESNGLTQQTTVRFYTTLEAAALAEDISHGGEAGTLYCRVDNERIACAFCLNGTLRWMTEDLGHVVAASSEVPGYCSCGSPACVKSIISSHSARSSGSADTPGALRRLGCALGSGLIPLISLLAPTTLIIDTPWNRSNDFLSGIRERIHGLAHPAAVKPLHITHPTRTPEPAGNAAFCIIDEILRPPSVDAFAAGERM